MAQIIGVILKSRVVAGGTPIVDPETWAGYETGGTIPKTWSEMETGGSYEKTWADLET